MKTVLFITAFLSVSILVSCGMAQNSQKMNSSTADSLATSEAKNKTVNDTIVQDGCPENKIVVVKNGGTFIIQLKSYPSRGYSWALDMKPETLKNVLFKGRTVEEPDPTKMDGAPTKNIFTFTGIQTGEETLRFRYARPFDKPDVKPLETCAFTLTVK